MSSSVAAAVARLPVAGGEAAQKAAGGMSQSVTILGRDFHFQTEVADAFIRTEVFLAGRLLMTRKVELDNSQTGLTQRQEMRKHHMKVVSGVLNRAQGHLLGDKERDFEDLQVVCCPQPGSESETAGLQEIYDMANVNLEALTQIDGFLGACLVDSDSGMVLGKLRGGPVDLELAAAGNTQVVRAKRKTMASLKLDDSIEDMLISLHNQYHLIRPLESNQRVFLYLVLDRGNANLAMARLELKAFESTLKIG